MGQELKLTTRGQYAVMAMVELGKSDGTKPIRLSYIAEKKNISLSYLEQLIAALRKHGLVKSYRGPGGGYILARPLSEIVVKDILLAAEDSTPAKRQAKNGNTTDICEHTQTLWQYVGYTLHEELEKVSLEDVLQKRIAS